MVVKIIPTSELRQKLKDILTTLEATGEPYFITQYSRPKAVLVRYEDYNVLVEQAAKGHPRIVRRPDIMGANPSSEGLASQCVISSSGCRPASRWMTFWPLSLT